MNTYYWHITDFDASGRWEGCQSVAREQIGRYQAIADCLANDAELVEINSRWGTEKLRFVVAYDDYTTVWQELDVAEYVLPEPDCKFCGMARS